ncbi:aldo/keto reductase [Roseateles cellulosilyticus]|uniref:Aldo/keto reductase n=1 Tax=Pelomonas cellulosilytica TaxID=2906762 RepID=A0ABS8Y3I5_9BURK|nr:aldo/keto reductase [Pelomonas sp. P8]MCE4556575.1 aldo/keto reductase [Pelomonas sp. P8]
MNSRRLGDLLVEAVGLGCMNLSHAYGRPPEEARAEALLHEAVELGMTWFDTAALYGFGANERLVGRVLRPHRDRVVLCSKGGMTGQPIGPGGTLQRVIDGRPESLQRDCEESLRRLGTDVIDLYYLHRWDKRLPIEDSVGALARLVEQGKVRMIGLSEVSGVTLRRAHAVHPIAALQSEYSLWSRDSERGALAACADLGVAFVAFSPLGRGFLAGRVQDPESLDAGDLRRSMPRFQPEAWASNRLILQRLKEVASELGCSLAQLALAWLLNRGHHVLAIPGTTQPPHLRDNWSARCVTLDPDVQVRLEGLMAGIAGERYAAATFAEIDSDRG